MKIIERFVIFGILALWILKNNVVNSKLKVKPTPEQKDWLNPALSQFSKIYGSSLEITIFTHDYKKIDCRDFNYFYKRITRYTKTAIVDYKSITTNDEKIKISEIYEWPLDSSIYILLLNRKKDIRKDDFPQQLADLLQNCRSRQIMSTTNSKVLVVVFEYSNFASQLRYYNQLLNYFWKNMKILDISVIRVLKFNNKEPMIRWINPFTREYGENPLIEDGEEIFPDKLDDMFGYPLKLATPNLNFIKRKREFFSDLLLPQDFIFVQDFVAYNLNASVTLRIGYLESKSWDSNIDMFLIYTNVLRPDGKKLFFGNPYEIVHVFAAIPKEETQEEGDNFPFYIFMGIVLMMAGMFVTAARILDFPCPEWNAINIWNCLLGASLTVRRRNFKQRVVYVSLLVASFFLSNEIISLSTEVQFSDRETTVESYENLLDLKFPIFSKHFFKSENGDNFLKSSINRIIFTDSKGERECMRRLIFKNDRICLVESSVFEYWNVISFLFRAEGLKSADFNYFSDYLVVPFYTGSPYVKKFNGVVQRSFETGFINSQTKAYEINQATREFLNYKLLYQQETDFESPPLNTALYTILKIGLGLACIVFMLELEAMQDFILRIIKVIKNIKK